MFYELFPFKKSLKIPKG